MTFTDIIWPGRIGLGDYNVQIHSGSNARFSVLIFAKYRLNNGSRKKSRLAQLNYLDCIKHLDQLKVLDNPICLN